MSKPQYKNSGIFFVNDRKESDTHPDFNGSLDVEGKAYWLNIWKKNGNKGEFFTVSIKPKQPMTVPGDDKPARSFQKPATTQQPSLPVDDDVPF